MLGMPLRRPGDALFSESNRYRAHPYASSARQGDQVVLMDAKGTRFFGVDETGARVWDLLQTPQSIRELVAVLLTEYDAPSAQVQEDCRRFIARLLDAGLVEATPNDET